MIPTVPLQKVLKLPLKFRQNSAAGIATMCNGKFWKAIPILLMYGLLWSLMLLIILTGSIKTRRSMMKRDVLFRILRKSATILQLRLSPIMKTAFGMLSRLIQKTEF